MQTIFKETNTRMLKSIDTLKHELTKIRTGRANPSLLDHIKVPVYGTDTPLPQIASVSVESARSLMVTPWDKSVLAAVEKAIMGADLGLNPFTCGNSIRVPMPALNEERRRELVKVVRDEAEESKIAIRNIRRDANQSMKDLLKTKIISEDEERRGQTDIQKLTDKTIVDIDKILAVKEAELMEV